MSENSNIKYCCEDMKYHVEFKCDKTIGHVNEMCGGCSGDRFGCPDCIISLHKGEYGIIIHDGSASFIKINHCPWCGYKLPDDVTVA